MMIRKPTDTDDGPVDIGPIVEDFHAVEMLREHLATIGWDADFRQLEAGQLQAHLTIQQTDGIGLVRMAVSHRVIGSCRSPDDMFTITMSVSKNALRVNGRRLEQERLLVIPPKTDVHVTSADGGWKTLSVLMSVDMLAKHLETHCDDYSLAELKKITLFDVPKTQLAPFRRLVAAATSQLLGAQTHAMEVSDIAAKSSGLLVRSGSGKKVGDPYRRLKKHRVVVRAKDYIHEHLGDHIRVTDVCTHCGVRLSTLERIFMRDLGIGPNCYVRAARLHNVRRELLKGNSQDLTIADIALNCGFTHMGRFSRRYRAHFGRLPSEERRFVNGIT